MRTINAIVKAIARQAVVHVNKQGEADESTARHSTLMLEAMQYFCAQTPPKGGFTYNGGDSVSDIYAIVLQWYRDTQKACSDAVVKEWKAAQDRGEIHPHLPDEADAKRKGRMRVASYNRVFELFAWCLANTRDKTLEIVNKTHHPPTDKGTQALHTMSDKQREMQTIFDKALEESEMPVQIVSIDEEPWVLSTLTGASKAVRDSIGYTGTEPVLQMALKDLHRDFGAEEQHLRRRSGHIKTFTKSMRTQLGLRPMTGNRTDQD